MEPECMLAPESQEMTENSWLLHLRNSAAGEEKLWLQFIHASCCPSIFYHLVNIDSTAAAIQVIRVLEETRDGVN